MLYNFIACSSSREGQEVLLGGRWGGVRKFSEGHTYLYHIVENYEKLSQWTVFTHAQAVYGGRETSLE